MNAIRSGLERTVHCGAAMIARRFAGSLLSCSLLACSMASSPPPSPGLYGPPRPYAPAQPVAVAAAPTNVAVAPPVASGALRVDGGSTACTSIVNVEPDGGASLLCNIERQSACVVRRVAANGFTLGDSERIPGVCAAAAARTDGGSYVVTVTNEYRASNIARLDARGRRVASTRFTSGESLYVDHLHVSDDGALLVSFKFRKDVALRGKRLGKTAYTTSGIAKLSPKLDRLAWIHLLDTRTTSIAALLPPTRDGVDAVINTRGPLVEDAPVNPQPDPNSGMFGGNTYGWKAERVAFDRRGVPAARTEVATPTVYVNDAAQAGDALAVLVSDQTRPMHTNVTLLRDGAEPKLLPLEYVPSYQFSSHAGTPWMIECAGCKYDSRRHAIVGTWSARDTTGRSIKLSAPDAMNVSWSSVAVRDDHAVLLGTGVDPSTRTSVNLTALAELSGETTAVDVERLQSASQLKLAPGCRLKSFSETIPPDKLDELDAPLATCGVATNSMIRLTTYADGGLRTFDVQHGTQRAPAKVSACVRRVVEPLFACPLENNNVSFPVRRAK